MHNHIYSYNKLKQLYSLKQMKSQNIINYNSNHTDSKQQHYKNSIDICVYFAQHKIQLTLPKQTKVNQLHKIIRSYDKLHQKYAPQGYYYIGLASIHNNQVLDYWLTQMDKTLSRFKEKTILKTLYSRERSLEKLTLNSFTFLKCLGKGVSCSVYLARNKITGKIYAIKQIQKRFISDYKKFEQILREKKILTQLSQNTYTIKFHCSFQSEFHLNFVTDYYPGGQLFFHMRGARLKEQEAQNYFAEILAGIQYLHKNKILYRDLKPQNILVDIDGHLRIADFGLSKCGFKQQEFTDSYCGSPEYMAPQMLEKNGYNFSLDFYTLGAILYEFVTGLPPFYTHDCQQLQHNIQNKQLTFSQIENKDIKQLLSRLLNKNPDLRLSNFSQLKNCQWLKNINWRSVEQKKLKVPFIPDLYKTYIHDQFLQLQQQTQELNLLQNQNFEPLFQFFNYMKPQSKSELLRFNQSFAPQNTRKTVGVLKKSNSKTCKFNKSNISLTIFQKNQFRQGNMPILVETRTSKHLGKQNILVKKQQKKSPFKIMNNYIGLKQQFNIFPSSTSNRKKQTSKQKDHLNFSKNITSSHKNNCATNFNTQNFHQISKSVHQNSNKNFIIKIDKKGSQDIQRCNINRSKSKQRKCSQTNRRSANKISVKRQIKKKQRQISKKQIGIQKNFKIRLA